MAGAVCKHACYVTWQQTACCLLHPSRLKDFGPNRLTPADKPGFLARVWNQLNNILIYILLAAAIVEGALQSWAEFGLVLGVIVVNTAIGLIQEGKAEKASENDGHTTASSCSSCMPC
jgi:magnesium-transporting ATPase (P-type)